MTQLGDRDARRQIREDLDATLVVEAAAGTGKTTELVGRVLALLRQGKCTLAELVAVTFTEKAAGEMKLRLRTEIERAREDGATTIEQRARLDTALEQLEAARIGTIHGFCADVLRERPVEAGVDPLFEVAAEDENERLFDESFERWFQAILEAPGPGVRRVLRRRTRERDADGPRLSLRTAGRRLVEQRDFTAQWRRDPFDREAAIDLCFSELADLGAFADKSDWKESYLVQNLQEVARFVEETRRREAVRGRDYDGLEAELRTLSKARSWTWKGGGQYFNKSTKLYRADVVLRRDRAKELLDRLLERADADLAALLHEELGPLIDAYCGLKTRSGKLDFLDLLLLTRDLLVRDRAVRNELQSRFTHLLVDEFQDTDPLQAEILLLLSADDPTERSYLSARPIPGKLFVVGDPKQSIYRFRRADVTLYEATKKRLVAGGAKLVHLSTSFRSAPSLQAAVNAAFGPLMRGSPDGSQAEYVALQPFREEPPGRPTIVALPVPRPYADWGKIANYKIDESLPDAVGAFVEFLISKSGWTITERDRPEPIPIESRHVCLLFKRLQSFGADVTRGYVRALEARRIAHVLVGGRSFHDREEVGALRNALAAIEWPDDELSVYATLRGPFFAIGDDALLAYRHAHGSLHTQRQVTGDELVRPVIEALGVLGQLHLTRNRRPIAATMAELLDATRAHAGVAIWPAGEQALANIHRVLDLARRFESGRATSFRGFVYRLDEDAERGGAADAPVVEEGTDGVRIMTVHKAKGLEFPVVILVDPTAPQTFREPSRYVDPDARLFAMPLAGCTPVELFEQRDRVLAQDREEAVRLAYVAATRARELLVVPVVGDEPRDGWLDVLNPVIFPTSSRDSKVAPGCPAFGEDTVFEWPDKAQRWPESSVRPGLHRPQTGGHGVVFWDPRALDLDRDDVVGLRQQRILAADENGTVATEGERLHAVWQERRREATVRGIATAFRVHTVTEEKEAGDGPRDLAAVGLEVLGGELRHERPHGKRFGVLVHGVLALVDLGADSPQILETTRAQARAIGAPEDEIRAAADLVTRALAHPLMLRARRAEACRRESPVLQARDDGTLLEGVVDLAFREEGRWLVVDFKTDREIEPRRPEYERQLRLYACAIQGATGEPASGVIFWV